MAKTPKVKKREVSIHSRAARRNASPPAKDLAVKAPTHETEYKPWLHNAQNAGISKKKKTKPLTRQQRTRQQKGLEKADTIVGKLEKKIADSKSRAKKVKGRRVDWDELNGTRKDNTGTSQEAMAEGRMEDVVVADLEQPAAQDGPDMSVAEEEVNESVAVAVADAAAAAEVPLPRPEDDEIL